MIRPLLWRLAPETAHRVALKALALGLGRLIADSNARQQDPRLAQCVWGIKFTNPIGLAAGFDKDAEAPDELVQCLGFGFVEVGTVTPRPQGGRPKPRIFRLNEDEAIINSMGFPSQGLEQLVRRLAVRPRRHGVLGVNLGVNHNSEDAASDYEEGIRRTAHLADYLVINVSSPNTPGLRDLQRRAPLEALLQRLLAVREQTGVRPPLLVKIAPDLSEEERADIAAVALASGIDGLVVANTTLARPAGLRSPAARAAGGLSGQPLFAPSTELLAEMYRLTGGRLPLVGVGGVTSAADAYAKIRAGASLVQLHTSLIFRGPRVVTQIRNGLGQLLRRDGFPSLAKAVGSDPQTKPSTGIPVGDEIRRMAISR